MIRLAVALWLVLALAVSVRLGTAKPGSHSVVPVYTNAAARWLAGENLYAPAAGLDIYLYGPGFAAFFAGFDPLPPRLTEIFWRLLSAGVLLAGLRRITQTLEPKRRASAFAWLALLATPCVNNGQANVIMAGLMTLGAALLMENRLRTAALCLSLAAAIKLYPVAMLMLAVVAVPRFWKAASAALLFVIAAPLLFQPLGYSQSLLDWLLQALVTENRAETWHLPRAPHDWTILPRVWFDVIIPHRTELVVSTIAGLTVAVIVQRRSNKVEATWLLGSIWMTLFGPCTEIPTYVLLAPAAVWWHAKRADTISFLVLVLLALPIIRGMFPTSDVFACRSAAPLGALLLLADAVRTRSKKTTPQVQSHRLRIEHQQKQNQPFTTAFAAEPM